MAHSIKMSSIEDQNSPIPQTEKDEIEEGRKVHHSIDIKYKTNGQDPSMIRTKKSIINQIFAEKLKNLSNSPINSCTIFKVNVWLRESNPDAYTPKMVSIGPYHNKNPQLAPMEKYKLLYLQRFLKRKKGLDVENCISELEELEEEARKCYDNIEDLDYEFCEMLLLDGCFVVEFIRERCGIYPEEVVNINAYKIFRDLMLLENQLPFFVLNQLHKMTKRDDEFPLAVLVGISFPFCGDLPPMTRQSIIETEGCHNIKHLLHLVHSLSCYGSPIRETNDYLSWHMVLPNATEFSKAGVSFANVSVTTSLFGSIKFENGVMTIPCFEAVDDTETHLRNLIAYEQQSCDVNPKYFSDFVIFMDHLIKSDKDVNLFRQKGIIANWIGEDKEVANLFNKLRIGVITYPDFYYEEDFRKFVEYRENPWNKMWATLMHNFFKKPLARASTLTALIIFVLTAIQTILAFTGPLSK